MLPTIAVIGAGTMGGAIIKGLLREELTDPSRIVAADPWEARLAELETMHDIQVTTDNVAAVADAEVVLLSVKPQVIGVVMQELQGHIGAGTLVFSIAAGVKIEKIREGLGSESIIRAMPNTPGQIGEGITVWTATDAVTEAQRAYGLTILQALGEEVYVKDESYLDMATALSGTGPAYVYLFMEAMVDAGVHLGFSRHIAEQLVLQTVIGSARYVESADLHLASLRNQVTSPGGTTAEALYHLEKGGFRTVLSRAIWAAFVRSEELGRNGDD